MNQKHIEIVRAAKSMFARYGFGKTTMADIAAEAGLTRQTLYNAFPGKSEILRAVVKWAGEEIVNAVEEAWRDAKTLEEKFSAFHQLATVETFESMHAAPDWAELMQGVHAVAAEELKEFDQKWLEIFRALLENEPSIAVSGPTELGDVAEFFYSASMNAKYGSDDVEHLRRRLLTIRKATMALLTQA